MAIDFTMLRGIIGYGSRSIATSKMEFFPVIVNDWKPYHKLYYNKL